SSPEFPVIEEALGKVFDDASRNAILSDASLLKGLRTDIVEGVYERVMPQAQKMAVLDDYKQPLLSYYAQATASLYEAANKVNQPVTTPQMKQEVKKENIGAKKSAGLPSQRSKGGGVSKYLSEEDEDKAYWEWYNNLQKNY
ncbi:MAG: hypothetical protein KGV46_01580, partial [Pasteurella sp.]|nr:hypothetical protein [Pasteurella sp.]